MVMRRNEPAYFQRILCVVYDVLGNDKSAAVAYYYCYYYDLSDVERRKTSENVEFTYTHHAARASLYLHILDYDDDDDDGFIGFATMYFFFSDLLFLFQRRPFKKKTFQKID